MTATTRDYRCVSPTKGCQHDRMVMAAPFGCDHPTLAVLSRVADEVAVRLRGVTDWGQSGVRVGQYLADVDVDDVAVNILLDAGFAVLSEESGRTGDDDRVV